MTTAHAHNASGIETDRATVGPSPGEVAEDISSGSQEGDELRQRLLNLILRNESQRKAQPR